MIGDLIIIIIYLLLLSLLHELILRFFSYMHVLIFSIFVSNWHDFFFIIIVIRFFLVTYLFIFAWEFGNSQKMQDEGCHLSKKEEKKV